jgi:hypothetical protein
MKFTIEIPDQLVSSAAGGAQSTSAPDAISGGAPAVGGGISAVSSSGEEYSAGSAEQPLQAQGSSIATFDGGAAPRA